MFTINTDITIAAPPSTVRKVFLDFSAYPEWNPFITSVQVSDPAAPPGTPFQVLAWKWYVDKSTIVENDPGTFSWVGVIGGKWFFRGQHYFKFEPFGDRHEGNGETKNCKFIQSENLSGALSLLGIFYGWVLKKGFKEMNKALKVRAEAVVAGGGA